MGNTHSTDTFICLGMAGSGKSSYLNTFLHYMENNQGQLNEYLVTNNRPTPTTTRTHSFRINNTIVWDSPGYMDQQIRDQKNYTDYKLFVSSYPEHIFVCFNVFELTSSQTMITSLKENLQYICQPLSLYIIGTFSDLIPICNTLNIDDNIKYLIPFLRRDNRQLFIDGLENNAYDYDRIREIIRRDYQNFLNNHNVPELLQLQVQLNTIICRRDLNQQGIDNWNAALRQKFVNLFSHLRIYFPNGWYGETNDVEIRIRGMIFNEIFDSLAKTEKCVYVSAPFNRISQHLSLFIDNFQYLFSKEDLWRL